MTSNFHIKKAMRSRCPKQWPVMKRDPETGIVMISEFVTCGGHRDKPCTGQNGGELVGVHRQRFIKATTPVKRSKAKTA